MPVRIGACLVAEFVGTFALCFVGMLAIHSATGGGAAGLVGVALAHGLILSVMVSATMQTSGGHFNPAVTFGFIITGKIKTGLDTFEPMSVVDWANKAVQKQGTAFYGKLVTLGLCAFFLADVLALSVGHFIPEPAGGHAAPQSNDLMLDQRGLIHMVDRLCGYEILETSL